MSIAILGINHKTAQVAVRERVAFSPEKLEKAFYDLNRYPLIDGFIIISTCNRSELYFSFKRSSDLDHILCSIKMWLCQFHNINIEFIENSLYSYVNANAAAHLMRVACGIDSLILGESQILGQVKKAYAKAQKSLTMSIELARLFQHTFYVAKRVRSTTHIGSNTASIAYAAFIMAKKLFIRPENTTVLLIGAGETIALISHYLKKHRFERIIIANRTPQKALELAKCIGAEVISLLEIPKHLKHADIIISSTASPFFIVDKELVERSLLARKYKRMLFIDLAVPRNIETEVANLEGASLATIDDLQDMINANLAKREIAAKKAECIIQEETASFMRWLRSRTAVDLIKAYRSRAKNIQCDLKVKAINAIKHGADIHEVIEKLSHRLTNRLIHDPTQSLLHAAKNDDDYLKFLSQSLGLKEK